MKEQQFITMESGPYRFAIELPLVDRLMIGSKIEEFSKHPNYTVARVQVETGEILALDLYNLDRPDGSKVSAVIIGVGNRQVACLADRVYPVVLGTPKEMVVATGEYETAFFNCGLLISGKMHYVLDPDNLYNHAPELSVGNSDTFERKRFGEISFENIIDFESPRGLAYSLSLLSKRKATGSVQLRSDDATGTIGFTAGIPTYAQADERFGLEAITEIARLRWEKMEWSPSEITDRTNIDSELAVIQGQLKALTNS